MNRITIKDLRILAAHLNELTGSPMEYMAPGGGAARGHYYISQAYGGYCLHRTCTAGGGVSTPLSCGHGPARPLYVQMQAYIAGLGAGKETNHDQA